MALALAALSLAVRVEARVFKVAGISMGRGCFDLGAIGKCMYKAAMLVDGREVVVSVLRTEGGVPLAGLIQGAAGMARHAGGEGMELGEVRDGGRRMRLISLPVAGDGGSMVVAVQSSEAKVEAGSPRDAVVAGVAVYPGATIKRVMLNTDTATTLRQAATMDEPGVVMAFYRASLARAGWMPALPADASHGGTELACFVKGPDMCWVLCSRAESDGETRLTLVNKRGGLNGTTGDR